MRVGYFWERGGYGFGTLTQSAKVQIPRPYHPLRKSPQKSPGGLKWQVLQIKPESTGRGGSYLRGGPYFWERGGIVLGHRHKVQKCKFPGRTTPLENHPKTPWGLKWQVLQIKPESTAEGGYCFGTETQSAKVQIPMPYHPLRKSPQKYPGGAKMACLANKTTENPSITTQDVPRL